MKKNKTQFKTIAVNNVNIFYREAGDKSKPVIVLLHGFPSSSHMYRNLIADLSDDYYVLAPDYPGFGQSAMLSVSDYHYTFDNLSATIQDFLKALDIKEATLYLQDYGGPVGFRLATANPSFVQALIIQNANAYNEGLGEALAPLVRYIQNPNAETEKGARGFLTAGATKWQYTDGAEEVDTIDPDSYIVDQYYLDRPSNDEIQLALFRDYGSNLPLYETWQAYFRTHQPPTLVISGKADKLFTAPGAEAFKKDLPDAQISLLNGGHFVLEEKHEEAASLIKTFLTDNGIK